MLDDNLIVDSFVTPVELGNNVEFLEQTLSQEITLMKAISAVEKVEHLPICPLEITMHQLPL